ncbi:PQQ-binding-like beta-propeller repeat protein [Nocardioides pelophilus]|uniref:PQQ-binding-like beta-propeller repeat protein n=1 Tax=Nocardioides pelophilus TaxID=2172019 RepID=UPI0016010F20|nr:PQQ-binding-like beta-propeller repeat protein [Nocardioides pelophilus]
MPAPPPTAPAPTASPPISPPVAPTAGRPRRLPFVLALLAVLAVAGAGGAGITYLANRDSDNDTTDQAGERAGGLDVETAGFGSGVSLAQEPGDQWLFDPDEVLPGSDVGYEPLYFDDVIVTDLSTEDNDYAFVSIDTDTGEVLWDKTDDEIGDWCSMVGDGKAMVCAAADDSGIVAVDPVTGDLGASYPVDDPWWANSVGSTVYVGSRLTGRYDYDTRLTALDLTTLEHQWTLDLNPGGGSEDYGSTVVQPAGGELYVQTGPTAWRLSTSGQVLSRFGMDLDETLAEGYIIKYGPGVRTWDRNLVLRGQGSIWNGVDSDIVEGRVGIGDTLYDVATGQPIWSAPDLAGYDPDSVSWEWASGYDYVFANDPYDPYDEYDDGGTTLVTASTGEPLWHSETPLGNYDTVLTDDAIATVSDEIPYEVVVRDLDDGEVAWTASVDDAVESEYPLVSPALTARALIIRSDDAILGFTDFPTSGGSDEGDTTSDDTAYSTACGSPPEFVPVESAAANGGITITYEVHATCPGGQWLNLSQLRVPLVVDGDGASADSGFVYADGYFDFSADPYWVPDDGLTLDLVYPYGQTTVPADDIAAAIDEDGGTSKVVFVPCEPGPANIDGAVPPGPEYGADPSDPNLAAGAPDQSASPEDRDESALEALERIAAEDEAAVEALDWTAQLSSKQPGTYDDGIVYDSYDDILALHLQLRAQYPASLLVFSSEWRGTYGPSSRNYWVTLSGDSELTTRPVLDWCSSTGRGEGDCWAVRVRRTGKPARNVDHAPADARNN